MAVEDVRKRHRAVGEDVRVTPVVKGERSRTGLGATGVSGRFQVSPFMHPWKYSMPFVLPIRDSLTHKHFALPLTRDKVLCREKRDPPSSKNF